MIHLRHAPLLLAVAAVLVPRAGAAADEDDWPRSIGAAEATIALYQPQPETFEGDNLTARAAVGIIPSGQSDPIFGTVWLSATVETDRTERMVYIREVSVPRVRFPDSTLEQEAKLSDTVSKAAEGWDLEISLDRLLTTLEAAEKQKVEAEDLGTKPPHIVYRKEPTVLILVDGEPRMTMVDGSSLMRVANTPFLVVFDGSMKTYYLYGGEDAWYTASDLTGNWKLVSTVPEEVAKLAPDPDEAPKPEEGEELEGEGVADVVPTILVATEPTEVIETKGDPEFTPVADNELMYVSNTDDTIILEVGSQRYFVLLSGRWFASKSLDKGPWEYVKPDALPEAFQEIAADSEVGDVRAFVAGTDEARDAVLDAQIPQTAQVDRKTATVTVEYDGDPKFEPIEKTELKYAVNTPTAVLLGSDGKYYACEDGVWYVSDSPTGPWVVATERPDGVEEIPASCPVYNVKYVYIYHVTPTVVYVGYTPAYTGCYVYYGTVVYGTGYYYPGWYGSVYYPRPVTWGFRVRWNPWTGFTFGIGFTYGRFTFGIGFGRWGRWHGGWFGPARWHGYRRGYHRGFHHGYRAGARAGFRAGMRSSNIYHSNNRPGVRPPNRPGGGPSGRPGTGPGGRPGTGPGDRPGTQPGGPSAGRTRENNLYSDRNGDVHRRNNDGSWDRVSREPSTRERSTPDRSTPSSSSYDRSSMNRDYQSRQRGSSRTQSFNQSRGGARAGGRGRR